MKQFGLDQVTHGRRRHLQWYRSTRDRNKAVKQLLHNGRIQVAPKER
jgi:hypothetical protein